MRRAGGRSRHARVLPRRTRRGGRRELGRAAPAGRRRARGGGARRPVGRAPRSRRSRHREGLAGRALRRARRDAPALAQRPPGDGCGERAQLRGRRRVVSHDASPSRAAATTRCASSPCNHRARVWVDGALVARHTGAYLPFEARVRLSSRSPQLVVPRRLALAPEAMKADGWYRSWFNFGGINREVTLRRLGASEIDAPGVVDAAATARWRSCDGRRSRLRNRGGRDRTLLVHGPARRGGAALRPVRLEPPVRRPWVRARVRIERPVLWSPGRPRLVRPSGRGARRVRLRARVGLRELRARRRAAAASTGGRSCCGARRSTRTPRARRRAARRRHGRASSRACRRSAPTRRARSTRSPRRCSSGSTPRASSSGRASGRSTPRARGRRRRRRGARAARAPGAR